MPLVFRRTPTMENTDANAGAQKPSDLFLFFMEKKRRQSPLSEDYRTWGKKQQKRKGGWNQRSVEKGREQERLGCEKRSS